MWIDSFCEEGKRSVEERYRVMYKKKNHPNKYAPFLNGPTFRGGSMGYGGRSQQLGQRRGEYTDEDYNYMDGKISFDLELLLDIFIH